MYRDNNKECFVIGTFVGAAVAGLTALLLAPKSGKEVRDDIKDHTVKTKEQAKDYVNKAKDKGLELKDSVHQASSDYLDSATATYEQLTNQVGTDLDKAGENLDKIKKEAKETAKNVKGKMNKEDKDLSEKDPTTPSGTSKSLKYDYDKDSSEDEEDVNYFNPENK
ncbi:YtxH domain-containing protein [Alkalibacterium sp. f15]|uniref:YtxH domain-containing protein n=1 Tax=Alkalibacterium sp. f15 TaxID=3414029 RepID=UPI003BF90D9B